MTRALVGGVSTTIVVAYAIGAGRWVSTDANWYRSLTKPPWQPPDVVFGLIWPYNFVMLAVAGWAVAGRESRTEHVVWLASLALSVVAALTWAYLFYVPHSLFVSGFALTAATLLTLPLVVLTFQASTPLGLALVPYQLWLAVATSLAFGYASRN
ncbi:MAG: tryptophan-rich sensory protein [Actinomycetota bacterium]|jgi:benzodiazapine receptor|nr:tryptophan-rich sensory protein [Actinomycetota bacterium]